MEIIFQWRKLIHEVNIQVWFINLIKLVISSLFRFFDYRVFFSRVIKNEEFYEENKLIKFEIFQCTLEKLFENFLNL